MRTALPVSTSTNVAATLPQSRNFRARLPSRQPVTTATASVAQRSISTNVTRRLRSLPCGSSMPSFSRPSIAMRTPRTCPAHKCPCACSASWRYSSRDFILVPLVVGAQQLLRTTCRELLIPIFLLIRAGHVSGPAPDGIGQFIATARLKGNAHWLSLPLGSSALCRGRVRISGRPQFLLQHGLLAPDFADHSVELFAIIRDAAVRDIIAKPCRVRIKRIELRQVELRHAPRAAVNEKPPALLPFPPRRLTFFRRQPVIQPEHPAHDKEAVCHIMRVARGELFNLAVHVQGTDLDVHDLALSGPNHPLRGEPFTEGDDVGLGGGVRIGKNNQAKHRNTREAAHVPSVIRVMAASKDKWVECSGNRPPPGKL